VCARVARPALLCGPSASPLEAERTSSLGVISVITERDLTCAKFKSICGSQLD